MPSTRNWLVRHLKILRENRSIETRHMTTGYIRSENGDSQTVQSDHRRRHFGFCRRKFAQPRISRYSILTQMSVYSGGSSAMSKREAAA